MTLSRVFNEFSGVADPMHVQKFGVGTWEVLRVIIGIPLVVGLRKANSIILIFTHAGSRTRP